MERRIKPRLSLGEIWNMSFGFLGIQMGFALQNANVSRIFESMGAKIEDIPILWIAAPVTGLIVQPIIGYMSDRTWGRLGRRRPYFLAGALLASLALLFMPNSPALWIAAGMLWIMDASINIAMEPFRAFVGDKLPSSQRSTGFAMQSFFIGTGAVIASLLPYAFTNWFGISNEASEGEIPASVKWSFYVGAMVFFLAVLWTVLRSSEYSPEEMAAFEEGERSRVQPKALENHRQNYLSARQLRTGIGCLLLGLLAGISVWWYALNKELYILAGGLAIFGALNCLAGILQRRSSRSSAFVDMMNDLQLMPVAMKQLAIVQFFSWFALFAMWIYSTAAITSDKYNMMLAKEDIAALEASLTTAGLNDIQAEEISTELARCKESILLGEPGVAVGMNVVNYFLREDIQMKTGLEGNVTSALKRISKEYQEGADWVGVCFGVYNFFSAIFAFLLMALSRKIGRRSTHTLSMIIGGLSLISVFFVRDPKMVAISFVGIGLVWASILSMPYALLTGSLPSAKMGYYMGVFNFFIVIPQIVAASILGFIVGTLFGGEAIYAFLIGGVSMLIGGILTIRVEDRD
jgi:maltose/moltooligosaccharide transporter